MTPEAIVWDLPLCQLHQFQHAALWQRGLTCHRVGSRGVIDRALDAFKALQAKFRK